LDDHSSPFIIFNIILHPSVTDVALLMELCCFGGEP
jgi:hypothetical protein